MMILPRPRLPNIGSSRSAPPIPQLKPMSLLTPPTTHNALDDALEQAEIFARVFEWEGLRGHHRKCSWRSISRAQLVW